MPDPECNSGGDGNTGSPPPGAIWTYEEAIEEAEASLSVSSWEYDAESAPCPRSTTGQVVGYIRHKRTGDWYEFHSRGTWIIDWARSMIYLPSGQAVYNWPQGFTGWWPATNISKGTGGALVKIQKGRGFCRGGGNVTFFSYYGVEIDDPYISETRTGNAGSGNGGGDGSEEVAPPNCHREYIYIEVDYGDGTGWHVIWEGEAWVCQ